MTGNYLAAAERENTRQNRLLNLLALVVGGCLVVVVAAIVAAIHDPPQPQPAHVIYVVVPAGSTVTVNGQSVTP